MPLARGLPPRLSPTARTLGECCKRGTLTGLPLALGARAFSSTREEGNLGVKAPTTTLLGPKRLWINIVNIIIIIIVVVVVVVAVVIITVVIPCFFFGFQYYFSKSPLPTFLHQLVRK